MIGWISVGLALLDICVLVLLFNLPKTASPNLLFGIYVPEQNREDPRVIAIRSRYKQLYMMIAIIGLVVGTIAYISVDLLPSLSYNLTLGFQLVGILIALFVCRRLALRLKAERQWEEFKPDNRKVADLQFRRKPIVLPSAWYLFHLFVVICCVVLAITSWGGVPERLAWQYPFLGLQNIDVDKTIITVFSYNAIQLGLILLFVALNQALKWSKQQLDPNQPEASRDNQLKYRRLNSIFYYIVSLLCTMYFGYIQAEMLYQWTFNGVDFATGLLPIVLIGGFILVVRFINRKMLTAPAAAVVKQDQHWREGVFYFNASDSSLFVSKRYGVGWTLNLARPESWIIIAAIVLVPAWLAFKALNFN